MNWLKPLRAWLGLGDAEPDQTHFGLMAIPAPTTARTGVESRLPRFSGAASEPDPHNSSTSSPDASRLSLAFTPAQPAADLRRFAGRAEVVERLIRTIEDRRMHIVVHGDRGMGKTSVLHVLAILAREARYLVRYSSCSEDSDFDELFRSVCADIPLLYHDEYDPGSMEAEKGLSLADTLSDRRLTPATLSESFAKLTGTRLLVILDEFDRTSSLSFRKSVAELIKNLSDRSSRVQIVIGGVANNLAELIGHIPSIRRNVLGLAIGPMSDDELLQIVSNGEAIANLRFDAAARAALLKAGNGSPYLVNLLGQQAARIALTRGSSDVSASDLSGAIAQASDELRSRLGVTALAELQVLEKAVDCATLGDIGWHAQRNFGSVPRDRATTLIAALGTPGEGSLEASVPFRFADDSIPVILWLSSLASADAARGKSTRAVGG